MSNTEQYLGDGVYADFDGYHIILTTHSGLGHINRIALEPDVLQALNKFAQACNKPDPTEG